MSRPLVALLLGLAAVGAGIVALVVVVSLAQSIL
jgi:hypothetical protein